jgi:hypothetical protein
LGTGEFRTAENLFSSRDVNFVRDNIAIIHLFFVDNAYGGFTKSELIGFTEFLSGCGGLLGLFMGFSVISLIEIAYFLTLRPYCAQKRKESKQNELEKVEERFMNRNSLRGTNKTAFIGQSPLDEYHKWNEIFQHKSVCQQIYTNSIAGFHYIKRKAMSLVMALKETYTNEKDDEGQAPYPYLN